MITSIADARGFQVSSHSKEDIESQARNNAALCVETVENADQVLGQAVAQIKHENNERYLYESQTQAQ